MLPVPSSAAADYHLRRRLPRSRAPISKASLTRELIHIRDSAGATPGSRLSEVKKVAATFGFPSHR